MATATATSSEPLYADIDAPLTPQERRELEVQLCACALGVRFFTRDLLALGRPYTVEYSLPAAPHSQLPVAPVQELQELGFDLISLLKSDLMQVKRVFSGCRSGLFMRVESLHNAPLSTSDATPLKAMQPNDFLVGLNDDDLLVVPPGVYSRVRRRILRECNDALQQQQQTGGWKPVLKLKFVRLDRVVQVDPSRGLGHGAVLKALEDLEDRHNALSRAFDELRGGDWVTVNARLAIPSKLMRHFGGWRLDGMDACMEELGYQIAEQTRAWIAAEWALNLEDSDDDEDEDEDSDDEVIIVEDVPMEEPEVFEIEDDSDDDEEEEDEEVADRSKQEDRNHDVRASAPTSSSTDTQQPARRASTPVVAAPAPPLLTRELRLHAVGAMNVDCRWRDVLQPYEMKWLASSHSVLTKFIEGLVDGFVLDGFWASEMAMRSHTIVETLVIIYARKLRTTQTDNVTVKKEFLHHARMLRSNIANVGNKQLRADVLSGAVTVSALCEMTSAQLAPEVLQAERQRRQEQHTKEITLSEPSGPRLVKTKHGFKEVGLPIPQVPETESSSQSSAVPTTSVHDEATPALQADEGDAVATHETKLTDEVTERLSAMEFEKPAEPAHKPDEPVQSSDPRQATARNDQPAPSHHVHPPVPRHVATVDTARYSTEDGRTFLRNLFDQAQEPVVETLRRLQHAIDSTDMLATMSTEMNVAGISMYRDLEPVHTHYGTQQRARVRLLGWKFEHFAPSGRDATIGALSRLMRELDECRRLFGGLLDDLRHNLHFPQPLHEHRVYLRAIDHLVRQGMTLPCYRERADFVVEARMASLILGVGRDSSEPAARDRAAHEAAAFLSELVALRAFRPPPVARDQLRDQQWRRDDRSRESNYSHADYRDADNGSHFSNGGSQYVARGPGLHDQTVERKRPLAEDRYTEYPATARRRLEEERHVVERQEPSAVEPAPLFFADSKGEVKPVANDPNAKEHAEKMQVEAYQELVRALVKNVDEVKAVLNFDWDRRVPEKKIAFSGRLSMIQKVSHHRASGLFRCELLGFDGNLNKMREHSSLDQAAKGVVADLENWLNGIRGMWMQLGDIYARVMDRKKRQRGNQADDSLSAANETRRDRAVSKFVEDKEKKRGHLAEYLVFVHGLIAVRQVCLNQKMAKRAAGEEFRDLLIWINKTRDEARNGRSTLATNNSTGGSTTPGARPNGSQAAARPQRRASNMVVCSDDSDDSGDDDDDHDGGGGYSDDDDWHPQPKQPNDGIVNNEPGIASDKSSRFRIETVLSAQYPIESEEGSGDDARLRAVLRSLFTPEDELCKEIGGIRGALKYKGIFDKQVVPNVKASIRLDLLRGDVFDVYASVNGVVYFKGSATSKQEACDKAINGLLDELDSMRRTWVQLVHFYHVKEMGSNNPMESFNALRLANIARIETCIETPPASTTHNRMLEAKMATDIHCVMSVGGKVVYRVNEEVEEDAHAMATCRTIQFIVDLIDKGLDPMPVDIQDNDFRPMTRVDWSCKINLQDFGNSNDRNEFHADVSWAIPDRIPSETRDFRQPHQSTIRQVNRIPIFDFEKLFSSSNAHQHAFFFRIEATYENGKFVNHVAEYGNKNKYRTYVLELQIDMEPDVQIFIFPPGTSVNGQSTLYWPQKIMPRELTDRKSVYGFAIRRCYAPKNLPQW